MIDLTVVIPVWDRYVAFLHDCLESVARQNGVRLRVLVVDNASGVAVAPATAGRAVDVLPLEGRVGVGEARNAGLACVETPFTCFMDADDRVLPGTFAFCVERLQRRPNIVACTTASLAWDPVTGTTSPMEWPRGHVYRLSGRRLPFALYTLGRCALPLTTRTVVRTEAVRAAGGFGDGNLAEDWSLGAALAFRGPVELHRRPGHLYRQHDGSLLRRAHSKEDYDEVLASLRRRLRRDEAVPGWVKGCLPAIGLLHRVKSRVLERASLDAYRTESA